jgi:hypothetical protein
MERTDASIISAEICAVRPIRRICAAPVPNGFKHESTDAADARLC